MNYYMCKFYLTSDDLATAVADAQSIVTESGINIYEVREVPEIPSMKNALDDDEYEKMHLVDSEGDEVSLRSWSQGRRFGISEVAKYGCYILGAAALACFVITIATKEER